MKFNVGDRVSPVDPLDWEFNECMIVVAIAPGTLRPNAGILIHAEPENGGFIGEYLEDEMRIFRGKDW